MTQHNYFRCYEVRLYDTTITRVSTNDFKPVNNKPDSPDLRLLPVYEQFTGYISLITAMKKAKAGALFHLDQLAKAGKEEEIINYRIAHYEDLNINLVDRNIRKLEQALNLDPDYEWQPYRINA